MEREMFWAVPTGLLLNSALYLLCVFTAGLVHDHGFAWRAAIAAMGLTYLGYLGQLMRWHSGVVIATVAASVAVGALAGLSFINPWG